MFTPAAKLDIATATWRRFEDGAIRIPQADVTLRADFHSVQKIAGPTGIRFLADVRIDGHADRFWSLALHGADQFSVMDTSNDKVSDVVGEAVGNAFADTLGRLTSVRYAAVLQPA